MEDTGLEIILKHHIGWQTQKAQRRTLGRNERSAFAFIDG
jgi:hypothetical protein